MDSFGAITYYYNQGVTTVMWKVNYDKGFDRFESVISFFRIIEHFNYQLHMTYEV